MKGIYQRFAAKGMALLVLAAVACLSLCVGCAAPNAERATAGVETTFVARDQMQDAMRVDLPDGWSQVLTDDSSFEYRGSVDDSEGDTAAPMWAWCHPPRHIVSSNYRLHDATDTYSLDGALAQYLSADSADEDTADFTVLPARTIDGNPARGYSYAYTIEGSPERREIWLVSRHDGLWEITLSAAPGDTELPPELDGSVLDSIRWTTPPSAFST